MKPITLFLMSTCSLALLGCGDATIETTQGLHGSPGNSAVAGAVYRVDLEPLNAEANGEAVEGTATIKTQRDQLTVTLNATGLALDMIHPQHIHGFTNGDGAECPPPEADVNGDGFIDVLEGVPFYGPILVSLDGDLSNLSFETTFPVAKGSGVITYRESDSLSEIEENLGAPLDVGTKHVVLHGVDPDTELPDTVASIAGLPAYLTLPVACGQAEFKGK